MDWMILPYHRYLEFSGRSRRREYWMFALLNLLVYGFCIALMLSGGLGRAMQFSGGVPVFDTLPLGAAFWLGFALMAVFGLGSILPSIAVTIRRLHDRDLSGWWYLGVIVAGMIPVIGGLASLAFLVLTCLEGTRGPNRFGPDPKDEPADARFG